MLCFTLAGFVAGRGDASLPGMVVAATVGSLVGAWVLYLIAWRLGTERVHRVVGRYGHVLRVTNEDVERAEGWFDRRAASAVLICRCVPLLRSLVSIPAGFRVMPLARFTVYTVVGSLVWNSALVGAGYVLGDQWEEVSDWVGVLQWVVVAAIAGAVLWFVWRRVIRPRWGDTSA